MDSRQKRAGMTTSGRSGVTKKRRDNMKKLLAVSCLILAVGMVGFPSLGFRSGLTEAFGNDKEIASAASQPRNDEVTQKKQILANNFAALQNQQARVIVLQQLLNRETGDLRQMEALFCDNYNLDVEKWREGIYLYDDKAGEFVEKQVEKAEEAKKPKKRKGWFGRK